MKTRFLILFFLPLFISSCDLNSTENVPYDWLEGKWKEDSRDNQWEIWSMQTDGVLNGIGFYIRDMDTIVLEHMKIVQSGFDLTFIADVKENPSAVAFEYKFFSKSEMVFENIENEFPKKITYQLVDSNRMQALIEGDGKRISFHFSRH